MEDLTLLVAHSPLLSFLKVTANSPVAKALYLVFVVGALTWLSYPILGLGVCVVAAGGVVLQMGLIFNMILKRMRQSFQGDLGDIRGHYKLVPDGETSTSLTPSGPRAFWVVEARHKISGRRELAGCAGLGMFETSLSPS